MIRTLANYDFRSSAHDAGLLRAGWGACGERGVLLEAGRGSLVLPATGVTRDVALEITIDPQFQACRCAVAVNGVALGCRVVRGPFEWTLPVPAGAAAGDLLVTFEVGEGATLLLAAMQVVQARIAPIPPPRMPFRELRFGWNDDGNEWLGEGWGTPEGGYVWAIGGVSTLRLPVESDGSAQIVLLDMRPHCSPSAPRQRVDVESPGCPVVRIELRDRLVNAVMVRPARGQSEVLLTFRNYDADFKTSDPFFHFGRPFAWALSCARIVPALPRFLPATRPPIPGSLADGTMRHGIFARLGLLVPDLVDQFINLGNCCEIGCLQRAEGRDRPGLLRLTAIRQRELVEGLFAGFHGVGRLEHMSYHDMGREHPFWRIIASRYLIAFDTPYATTEPFPAEELLRQSRRLPRLAEMLVDDMVASDRIFLFKIPDPCAAEPAMLAVQATLRCFGDAAVVFVAYDGSCPPGSAERLACGVVRCHIEPPGVVFPVPAETLASGLANALILLRQGQPLAA